jgi:hypothetical protein
MSNPLGTFILDFQSVDFERDARIANEVISELQKNCQLENQYALDEPVERAGWSFAKLFLSGQFVERIIAGNSYEIERTKGRKFQDKIINWVASRLKNKGCGAQIKAAPEMKDF